jgi:hypothetical protein
MYSLESCSKEDDDEEDFGLVAGNGSLLVSSSVDISPFSI